MELLHAERQLEVIIAFKIANVKFAEISLICYDLPMPTVFERYAQAKKKEHEGGGPVCERSKIWKGS